MPPQFPRPERAAAPTTGADDELLADPPESPRGGSIEGYRAGSRTRRWVFGVLVVVMIGAVYGGTTWIRRVEEQRRQVTPSYDIDPETAATAPRELYWSTGIARLGLSREAPGVEAIVLPDRVLRLADGCDHAQVKVEVRDGRTVRVEVLVGEIVQQPLTAPPGSAAPTADPGATAR